LKFDEIIGRLEKLRDSGAITKKEADMMAIKTLKFFVKIGACVAAEQNEANKKKKWVFKKMSKKQADDAAEMWDEFDKKFGIKANLGM